MSSKCTVAKVILQAVILSLRWLYLSLGENNGKTENKSPLSDGSYSVRPFLGQSLELYLLPGLFPLYSISLRYFI